MTARAHIPLISVAASMAARLLDIPHEHQKLMHPEQVMSLVHVDHYPIPKAEDGSDHFSNLYVRPIREHKDKTAKVDVPSIAKRKRIARAHEDAVRRLLAKSGLAPEAAVEPERRRRSSSFAKGRKIAKHVDPWGKNWKRRQNEK